jgi:fluoroquinolone transport system permease protein
LGERLRRPNRGGLLLNVPETARANGAAWVPAILVVNLQITTFFFMAALMLLERDEGTLIAIAVSPFSPGDYLATRTITLTALGAMETAAVVWIAFGTGGSWPFIISATAALGVIYTGLGAAVGSRYASVNALLLPAYVVGPCFSSPPAALRLAPRAVLRTHRIGLTLIRAGYAREPGSSSAPSAHWPGRSHSVGTRVWAV